jgi:hypothetical protein
MFPENLISNHWPGFDPEIRGSLEKFTNQTRQNLEPILMVTQIGFFATHPEALSISLRVANASPFQGLGRMTLFDVEPMYLQFHNLFPQLFQLDCH